MTYLLTGASGFVGAHILDYLLTHTTDDVVCIVRGNTRRLLHVLPKHDANRVRLVCHDLTQPFTPEVDEAIGDVDVVISAASSTDIAGSLVDAWPVYGGNVTLVARLVEWARHRDLTAFVHVSSEEIYGPAPVGYHREWESPLRPSTPYSASKVAQEALLIAGWRAWNVPLVLVNIMNQLGPMQEPGKLVPLTIRRLTRGESVVLVTGVGGEQSTRQYMHPRVVASGILYAVNAAVAGDTGNTRERLRFQWADQLPPRFHIAGTEVGNVDLAGMVADELGVDLDWVRVFADYVRPGHDLRFALDDSKLRNLGWESPSTLEQDVAETVAWYREHQEWLA